MPYLLVVIDKLKVLLIICMDYQQMLTNQKLREVKSEILAKSLTMLIATILTI
jgi:hypothetical protein